MTTPLSHRSQIALQLKTLLSHFLNFRVMNNLRNSVRLLGKLGNNPEITEFDNGKKKARMSMATTEIYRNAQGEKVSDTQWHHLVAWGPAAVLAEKLLQRGSDLAVEGRLVHRNFEDKEGKTRYVTEVVVHSFMMIGRKAEA